jgi:hypothetical protein
MRANNLKKSLICTALLGVFCAGSTQAATVTVDFAFQTVPDVSILLETALDFGGDVPLSAGSTCIMLLDIAVVAQW